VNPLARHFRQGSFFYTVLLFLNRLAEKLNKSTVVAHHPDIDKVKTAIKLAKEYLDATNEHDYDRTHIWHDKVIVFSYNLPDELKNNIISCIAIQSSEAHFSGVLNDQILAVSANYLSCREWLFLSDLFRYRAHYSLAHICREKALFLALEPFSSNRSNPPISWENSISAALESGACRDHKTLEEMLDNAKIRLWRRKKWHLFLAALNGELKDYEEKNLFIDPRFRNFVKDESIGIFGRALSRTNELAEAESHDFVVRINYKFDDEILDAQLNAERNCLFYFNGGAGKDFVKSEKILGLHPKNWFCFKGRRAARWCVKKFNYVNCRFFTNFDDMTFHGTFNMAPLVILDLALHDTKTIRLCRADLYLSIQHDKGDDINGIRDANVLHDPVLQYLVLTRLWNSNVFIPDERLKEILSFGLIEYLSELEKIYM
jgi:hypothetical protein